VGGSGLFVREGEIVGARLELNGGGWFARAGDRVAAAFPTLLAA
jgi:hypothetical protein